MSAFAILFASSVAAAQPTAKECIAANEASIALRAKHALHSAREATLVCTNASCPPEVRLECERRLRAFADLIPSIVFTAKDGDGNDLDAVRVIADGKVLAERLDGTSLALDPASYNFSFESQGRPTVRKTIVLAEGDHRKELVVFPRDERPVEKRRDPTRRAIGIVTAGVGLGGIALGAIMGSLAASSWSTSQSACSTTACSDHAKAVSAHDDAMTFATVSTIGFIAGPILVAAGGVLFFTAPWVTKNQAGVAFGATF